MCFRCFSLVQRTQNVLQVITQAGMQHVRKVPKMRFCSNNVQRSGLIFEAVLLSGNFHNDVIFGRNFLSYFSAISETITT